MTLVAEPAVTAPQRWPGSGRLTQVRVLSGRSLRTLRDPRLLVMSLLQPLIMLTLFSQVFRGIAQSPGFPAGVAYIDYLMPAILVTTASQAAMWSGAGLATDLKNGALARFRTLPISMTSVLVARSVFDLVRSAVQLAVLALAAALLYGYSPAGGLAGTAAALVIGLAVGSGLSWVFLALASWVRNVELMQMLGFIVIFPLMFASSAFVPVSGLPGWLQVIAAGNPLTYAIDAARGWALAEPTVGATVGALLAAALLTVAAGVVAARGVRRP
ncbi:MAG: ABC transporter permease [Chloroflexi bacterium]|nr:ABC transporter permease [Chloroflexota bacterium]